ncbi:MAG: twin-arginine translocase TatA/TatE family subunit [Alphaproteobacteria bacterium]
MGLSIWHLLVVLLAVVIIFGFGKLPRVMGDLGKGIKNFKEGIRDEPAPPATTTEAKPVEAKTDKDQAPKA